MNKKQTKKFFIFVFNHLLKDEKLNEQPKKKNE